MFASAPKAVTPMPSGLPLSPANHATEPTVDAIAVSRTELATAISRLDRSDLAVPGYHGRSIGVYLDRGVSITDHGSVRGTSSVREVQRHHGRTSRSACGPAVAGQLCD